MPTTPNPKPPATTTPTPPVEPTQPVDEPKAEIKGKPSEAGYHDSQSGRAVDQEGNFLDATEGEGPIPAHRIVANDWAS